MPYDPSLRICWSLDFNINPMCSGIIQHHRGNVRVIDELSLLDTDTDSACEAFLNRARDRHFDLRNMVIYGDASGWARDSTSGKSDWSIVMQRMHNWSPRLNISRGNPVVKDTINAVRAILRPSRDESGLTIDPRCRRLIDDLRSATWPEGNLDGQHALAWFRYFVEREYPILGPIPESTGGVGFSR
jgi:hypothetical protein